MLTLRQLLPMVTLALMALQIQVLLQGSGQALARPVQNVDGNPLEVVVTQPRASVSDSKTGQKMDPEAVLKALQTLANGIQYQQGEKGVQTPVLAISHGEGGPVDPSATAQTSNSGPESNSKANDQDGSKDNKDKTKTVGKQNQDSKTNNSKSNDSKDKTKGTKSSASKAPLNALQQPRTRFCAQPANTNRTIDEISQTLVQAERKRLAAIRKTRTSRSKSTDARSLTDAKLLAEQARTVDVVWHVIHSGRSGNLSDSKIENQISVLNEDYKAYGFEFNLTATNRVNNTRWYRNVSPDTSLQTEMKAALRQGDAKTLNLYSVDFNNGLLGYSSFPWSVQDDLTNDGVVFQYSTVPGGSETGYNLGKTATHEVGHWLGLYHVFQGGCASPGDYVDDTPPQSVATSGCPAGQDSCRGGGVDSIHNYMDYSSDACLTEFTEGQAVRMAALSGQYRSL